MSKSDLEERLKRYWGSEASGRMSWEELVKAETFHQSYVLSCKEVDASPLDLVQAAHAMMYHNAWLEAIMRHPGKRIWQMTVRFDIPVTTMSYKDGSLRKYCTMVARTIVEVDE